MHTDLLHSGLLTVLWQTCFPHGTYAISWQNLRFFFFKWEGVEPLFNLPLASWPHKVCFYKSSSCQPIQSWFPRLSWSLLSRVLNVLNRTCCRAYMFCMFCSAKPSAHPLPHVHTLQLSLHKAAVRTRFPRRSEQCFHTRLPPHVKGSLSTQLPLECIFTACANAKSTTERRHISRET